jgi:hypothetical protein
MLREGWAAESSRCCFHAEYPLSIPHELARPPAALELDALVCKLPAFDQTDSGTADADQRFSDQARVRARHSSIPGSHEKH